jgi:signal peptidase I
MKQLAFTILIVVVLTFTACNFGYTRQVTNNMAPTIKVDDLVWADTDYYKRAPVARGDIVMVSAADPKMVTADGPNAKYLYRVIGLGGDRVQVREGRVYVNENFLGGAFASGKYETNKPVKDFGPIVVPPEQYFLIGDNLPDSYDSRHWAQPTIKKELIYGKVTEMKDAKIGETRAL